MSANPFQALLGQIGADLVTAAASTLAQADYTALGVYKPVAQAGALILSEFASVLAAKWAPPPPTGATPPEAPGH